MQNKKLVILIIVSILAVISLIYGISSPSKTGTISSLKPVEGYKIKDIIPQKRAMPRTNFTSWGRNPFLLKEEQEEKKPALVLVGILWEKDNPRAIISDNIVTVGDRIGENKVIRIEPNYVILNDGASDIKLELWLEEEK